ncbi:hypothetical protein LINGRAHAP2_LOCUS14833 [Linum grandiflorum]
MPCYISGPYYNGVVLYGWLGAISIKLKQGMSGQSMLLMAFGTGNGSSNSEGWLKAT